MFFSIDMSELNFPGLDGVLNKPVLIDGTDIEIIRPFDGSDIRAALFDFDGTLSKERDGWIDIMLSCNSDELVQSGAYENKREAMIWAAHDIAATIGIPTYMQMKRLAEHIMEKEGGSLGPREYKSRYTTQLGEFVARKHESFDGIDLRVQGSINLLEQLSANERLRDEIYIASGTDIEPIRNSVELLGYSRFFGDRIVAAGSSDDPEQCAKQTVIGQLIGEKGLQPGQLLTFGDGFPEILHTYNAGGVCVGVLTPDLCSDGFRNIFTLERKKARLVNAGAHIIVKNFSYAGALLETIKEGYRI